ncbi:MAG TPA: sugar transferase [Blastocatellia bacterium]|nr:sugar transferase [Blastocatellia bacterium]
MSEHAAAVAEHAIKIRAGRRSIFSAVTAVASLVFVDLIITALALVLAYKIHNDTPIFDWKKKSFWPVGIYDSFEPYLTLLLFAPFVNIWALRRNGLYKLRGEFSFTDDFIKVFKASTLAFLVMVLIAFLFRQGVAYRDGQLVFLQDFSYSRMVFVYNWLISTGMFWITRTVVRGLQILYRTNERNLIPTIVVGSGEMAHVCISEISSKPRLGYRLIGAVTAGNGEEAARVRSYGVRKLGAFDDLPELVKKYGIEEVLITDTSINPGKMFEVLMECGRDHHIKYRVIPNLFDCLPGKTEIDTIGSVPMIKLYEEPLRGPQRVLKRSMDVIASTSLFLVTWPLWLALAIMIKMESRGPVFLRQERVGMDGKLFLMWKFRSMHDGADDRPHRELMRRTINGEDANQGTPDQPLYGKLKDDPRLTKIGGWMRRYSIDELPQIINVFKGDMSIVGPRPPLPYEVRCYKDWHRARFHVRPGITGLWQVSGRNRLHFEEMVRLDVFYIENWSPWLDLKIMLKTPAVMLRGDNTY